jgi:uncharacterized membrane protein
LPLPTADDRLEQSFGHLLRAGVIASALVVAVGGTIYLVRHGCESPDNRTFHGEPAEYRNPLEITRAALHGQGRGVIAFGLLVLISTPIARVVFSAIAFDLRRDRLYLLLTMFVLRACLCRHAELEDGSPKAVSIGQGLLTLLVLGKHHSSNTESHP